MNRKILSGLALTAFATVALADDPVSRLEEVSILGDPDRVSSIAGSAHLLDEDFLARFEQGDIMRVLRAVPGVYLQEEDGSGLRPNIGIRGSGLDRSSRIALLEDGVLIAPAPYAAPSAYYFPTQRRMSSVEVLKGPAAVRLGPRTTGGALNMISTPLPTKRDAQAALFLGEDGLGDAHGWIGDSTGRVSWLLETVQQQSDGFKILDNGGPTGYETHDYLGKLRLNSRPDAGVLQSLEFKTGYTDHVSDETYLGLTDQDFAATPYRRYAGSQLDQLRSTHRQYQVSYLIQPAEAAWRMNVTAYRNEFARNWFKLDAVNGSGISKILDHPDDYVNELAWLQAESDSPDDALKLRNNNRAYLSRGVQATLSADFDHGAIAHDLQVGVRVHEDEEDRFQHDNLYAMRDGDLYLTTQGAPGTQSNRVGTADVTAFFAEDRIDVGRLELTPGLRYERIELSRRDYAADDPARTDTPTRDQLSKIDVLIPGVSASLDLDNGWIWLAGINRGFNPPAPGSRAKQEDSTNFEFGARYGGSGINAEAIAFYNDYSNLVGTCTASTGGDCSIGDQFDGGKATVGGLEMLVGYEAVIPGSAYRLPVRLTYTWTGTAEFKNSFESGFGPWGSVVAGDELPYVPEHQFQIAADVVGPRWSAGLNLDFVGDSRTVAGQGAIAAQEAIDSHWVVDFAGRYRINDHLELFGRVDNLLDEVYAAARRPAGLRPGKPRTALVGLQMRL